MADQTGTVVAVARSLPYIGGNATFVDDERMTVAGALQEGGLAWDVVQRPISTHRMNGTRVKVPGWVANMRADTEDVLGIVGDRYRPYQNVDALAVGDELVARGAQIEAAGSLRGGKIVFVSFRLPWQKRIGDDEIDPRLIVSNSHDGNSSIRGIVGPIRLRCTNMLTLTGHVRGYGRPDFSIRHTSGASDRMGEAAVTLLRAQAYLDEWEKLANRLRLQRVTEGQIEELLARLWPTRDDATPAQRENAMSTKLFRQWRESDTIEDVRETAWGVYNAVGEYLDHEATHTGRRYTPADTRAYATLFGPGLEYKAKVADALLSLN